MIKPFDNWLISYPFFDRMEKNYYIINMQYQLDFAIDTLPHTEILQYLDKAGYNHKHSEDTEELREILRTLVEKGKIDVSY